MIANQRPTSNRIGLNNVVLTKTEQNVIVISTIEDNNKIITNSTNVNLSPKTNQRTSLSRKDLDKFVLTIFVYPTIYKIITIYH